MQTIPSRDPFVSSATLRRLFNFLNSTWVIICSGLAFALPSDIGSLQEGELFADEVGGEIAITSYTVVDFSILFFDLAWNSGRLCCFSRRSKTDKRKLLIEKSSCSTCELAVTLWGLS